MLAYTSACNPLMSHSARRFVTRRIGKIRVPAKKNVLKILSPKLLYMDCNLNDGKDVGFCAGKCHTLTEEITDKRNALSYA